MSTDAVTASLSSLEAALVRLTTRLRNVSSFEDAGEVLDGSLREAIGASEVFVRVNDPDGRLRSVRGRASDASVAFLLGLDAASPPVRTLLDEGVPVWNLPVGEVGRRLSDGSETPWPGIPADHMVCFLPLNAAAGAVGGLGVVRATAFDGEERWFLFAVAAQASQVVERLQALERERSTRQQVEAARSRLQFLGEMTTTLVPLIERTDGEPWTVLRRFCELAVPRLGDACFVRLLDEDRADPIAMAGPEELVGPLRSILSHRRYPAILDVLRRREVVMLGDVTRERIAVIAGGRYTEGAWPILSRVRALIHVPVFVGEHLAAAVTVVSGRDQSNRTYLPEDDLQFFEEIGIRLSMFVENASRFERGRRVAETFQRTLLPERLPSIPGIAAAARYLPASDEDEVGGDWYELVEMPDGRVVAAVGDVVGSGIEAAASMGEFRTGLRALALEGHEPGRLLERVSEFASGLGRGFATAFVAVIDPARGQVRYATAGHPPAFLVSASAEARALDAVAAVPLAVEAGVAYPEGREPMAPGDTLVLYTDGLIERRGESIDRGLEALRSELSHPRESAERVVADLVEAFASGPERDDDVAIIAVRLLTGVHRFERVFPARSASVARFRAEIREWLERAGVGAPDVDDVVLAVSEACSNAIEHAGSPEGSVSLAAELRGQELVVSVRDQGRWRPPSVRPERGRGLSILRTVMDSLDVHRRRGGTEIRMHRKLGVRP